MKEYLLKAEVTFSAENSDDALRKLGEHFIKLADGRYSKGIDIDLYKFFTASSKIHLKPIEEQVEMKSLEIEIFAALCDTQRDSVNCFDWVVSPDAVAWLYQMQTDTECQKIVWDIIKKVTEEEK